MFGKGIRVLLLQELIKDWPCTIAGGGFRVEVTGITEYSMNVKPGFIFVARKGEKDDGVRYIDEAINAGAVAIVIDRLTPYSAPTHVPVVTVPDCRHFISHASAVLSGEPSKRLTVIAVTGTNGKTTVSHFIGQLLTELGMKTAIIGTTGVFINHKKVNYAAPEMTTLPAEYFHPLLKYCEDEGVTHIVLEASSLGLEAHRLAHCKIDIGILLNISKDHYDEHGGKKPYIQAKKKLLEMAEKVIINRDDGVCVDLAKTVDQPYTFFGTTKEADIQLKINEGKAVVQHEKIEYPLLLSIIGQFNQLNTLAAVSALHALSYNFPSILQHIPALKLPEGRMQRVERDGLAVIIDYAHTPAALEVVLQSLVEICTGRVITVFGCGGGRDKGKRKEMGEVASLYSSIVLVTSDNPRNEEPLAIISTIIEGTKGNDVSIEVEPNRAHAIQKAIAYGKAGDIILIAGKGHEKTQHIGREILPFSDVGIVKQVLNEKKK